jgi:hypothetical protein
VIIALRCGEFEQHLSEYIEGETSLEQTEKMDQHVLQCPACQATVRGVRQICHQLGRLAQISPPASFKLGLWPAVQERQARRQERRWHALTFGLALGVALLILLWPEPQEQFEPPDYASWDTPAYQEYPWRAAPSHAPLYGGEQLPERAYSGLRAQAQVHLTAF